MSDQFDNRRPDEGDLLARIPTPQTCSNCAFGGEEGSRLFFTSGANLYAVDLLGPGR